MVADTWPIAAGLYCRQPGVREFLYWRPRMNSETVYFSSARAWNHVMR